MKYCTKCGKLLGESQNACPVCGGSVKNAESYLNDRTALNFLLSALIPFFGIYKYIKIKKKHKEAAAPFGYGCLLGCLLYVFLGVLCIVI